MIPRAPGVPSLDTSEAPEHEHEPPPPTSRRTTVFAYRLADLQVARPLVTLVVAAVLTAIALAFASHLRVLTGFEYLLPEDRPSVRELNRVAQKTAGVSTLFVVLRGGPATTTDALRGAGDAIVRELVALGPPWVGSAEDGIHEAYRFLAPRAGLYADRERLEALRADIDARFEYEVAKASGTLIDDSEPPPPLDATRIRKELGVAERDMDRYPGGYYQSEDGKTLVVAARSKVLGSDFQRGSEALARIRAAVEKAAPTSFDPAITYGFAGDLQTGISEYAAINRDLTDVGVTGVIAITAVVFLYYLRLRTLLAMALTVGVGVAWTFGVTEVAIGHLNMATGFLFTIIAGNGLNFGVIYMARFLEVRRRGATLVEGIRLAHKETWAPTLTAACAASAAYGSLLVTEFRGFRDFGLIGGAGMVLCWIATYTVLPSVLTIIERLSPIEKQDARERRGKSPIARLRELTQGGVAYGRPFAALVPRAPRLLAFGGAALGVLGFIATVRYVHRDPMEYDLKNLRNDPSARADEIARTELADKITGYVGSDGMAILVDDPADVPLLRDVLDARRDAAPAGAKPFDRLWALEDFVPPDQAAKIPTLLAIKARALRARQKKVISDADWARLEPFLPPDDVKPFAMDDLPMGVARAFTETDGRRGRIAYISPTDPALCDDAHYLFRWADAYREAKLANGKTVLGSGRAVIYADMWAAIVDDVPPAIAFSFVATVLVVVVAFRAGRAALAVLGALLVGVGWMAGLLVLGGVKLNFLNFIALPITFGIGVDYAVNVVGRYVREGAGGALTAVRETGGAVILCSLTTMLGYLALVRSMNYAVRSLGIAAVLGEISCLLAAVVVLPAALLFLDRHLPAGATSRISLRPKR